MKKGIWKKRISYLLFLFLFTVLVLEIVLRIYNPFPAKFIGKKFELPANTTYHIKNDFNSRLDKTILHRRNSLGFRGPEPPAGINDYLSIIAVGGSTTACTYLSEGQTWCDQFQQQLQKNYSPLWINNAGVDGHTTNGHLNFLYNYLPRLSFKPKILLFLAGANDVVLFKYDSIYQSKQTIDTWLREHSETVNLLYFLKWSIKPKGIFVNQPGWNFTDFKRVYLDSLHIDSALKKQNSLLQAFEKRLNKIVAICRERQIQPVLVTQPCIFGDGTATGGNPAIDFHSFHKNEQEQSPENGQLFWLKLEQYNQKTKEIAAQRGIFCIDLAKLLPKDTTYFYDAFHYTKEGAEKVARILTEQIDPFLRGNYPGYRR